MVVTYVYKLVKFHGTVHIKWVYLIVYKLYLNIFRYSEIN